MTIVSTKLDDLHLILLSSASRRDDRSVFPTAKTIRASREQIEAATAGLLKAGLLQERGGVVAGAIWRKDGDARTGVHITDAGLALIDNGGVDNSDITDSREPKKPVVPARAGSKTALLLDLLSQPDGARLDAITGATGWLPHSTRAALSGLRKKGHLVNTERVNGVTRYRIGAQA